MFSQPTIEWANSFGGDADEFVIHIKPGFIEGSYTIFGTSDSHAMGDVPVNNGMKDCWLFQFGANNTIWAKTCLGGSYDDVAGCLADLDVFYYFIGTTCSNDGDVSGNNGACDIWFVCTEEDGNIYRQDCYGGSSWEEASSVFETRYQTQPAWVIGGNTVSDDGDVSGNHGYWDFWILKINVYGQILWQNCYGGSSLDGLSSLIYTQDTGIIAIGATESYDGDVTGNHGESDIWVIKLDEDGNLEWQKCYGGSGPETGNEILSNQPHDNGYILIGTTFSNDGDVSGNHGDDDIWIVKIDSLGNLEWQKCIGGSAVDFASSAIRAYDGGIVIVGSSNSNDGDVSGNLGEMDYWVVKVSAMGDVEWQTCLGGCDPDEGLTISPTWEEDGYLVGGYVTSEDGMCSGGHGGMEALVVRLSLTGDIIDYGNPFRQTIAYPNPFSNYTTIDFDNPEHKEYNLILWNSSGKIIREINNITTDQIRLSRENLPKGQYLVEIRGEEIYRNKLIIY